MTDNLKQISDFFKKLWFKIPGLAVVLLLIATFVATVGAPWVTKILLLLGAWATAAIIWVISRRPRKTKKDHIGFVVGISCEDDEESQRIRSDFIVPLQQLLYSDQLKYGFDFIELPDHISEQIKTLEDAQKIRRQARAHFMFYGRARERDIHGGPRHIIELTGIVQHKVIPKDTKEFLEKEFSELSPSRVEILKENDALYFEFASEWAATVAEYIIGCASELSGDLNYAESLYNEVAARLEKQDDNFPVYAKLKERIEPTPICVPVTKLVCSGFDLQG